MKRFDDLRISAPTSDEQLNTDPFPMAEPVEVELGVTQGDCEFTCNHKTEQMPAYWAAYAAAGNI